MSGNMSHEDAVRFAEQLAEDIAYTDWAAADETIGRLDKFVSNRLDRNHRTRDTDNDRS